MFQLALILRVGLWKLKLRPDGAGSDVVNAAAVASRLPAVQVLSLYAE